VTDPRITIGLQQTGAAAEPVAAALDSVRPVVRIGGQLHPSAAAAAAALVSMLARIHPHTILDGDAPVGHSPWDAGTVQAVVARLDGVRRAATRPPEQDFVIGVGTSGPADLWVGGDDWTVLLGRDEQPIGAGSTGYGIQAAAALAAAEVLKVTLGPLGFMHRSVGERFVWNLIDHQLRPAPVTPAVGPPPPLVLFGAGSVNSSAAAMLTMLPRAGTAVVVDPDVFDRRRNPYRYPAALPTTTGSKAAWVAGILRDAGWGVRAQPVDVAMWATNQPAPGFAGIAVSSVDRVDARVDVADVLAHTTLSLGVAGLALHLQREHPADDAACPYCQYVAVGHPITQVQQLADLTGLPLDRVAELIDGAPLTEGDVAIAIGAGRISPAAGAELVGRRIDDLVHRAYAEASVPAAGSEPVLVSAPCVSWMAGVLATSEVAKAAAGLPLVDRRVDLDLSGLPLGAVRRLPRDRSGRCLCASPFRQRAAHRLYGDQR
jgi:hypothetical protein